MKFNYMDFIVDEFIKELDLTLSFFPESEYLRVKKMVDEEIQKKLMWFEDEKAKWWDDEIYVEDLICQYQEFETLARYRQYNELSSYFQKIYARFETQIEKYASEVSKKNDEDKKGKKVSIKDVFDFSKYPIIGEMNSAVNVMKHSKGLSLEKLKETNSKFVQTPEEFENMFEGYVTDVILNLHYSDLEEFVDEAKRAWFDLKKENQTKRAQEVPEKE